MTKTKKPKAHDWLLFAGGKKGTGMSESALKIPKFPLCSKYGLFVPLDKVKRKDYLTYKTAEKALSKAEKSGAEKVYSCGNCLKLEKKNIGLIEKLSDTLAFLGNCESNYNQMEKSWIERCKQLEAERDGLGMCCHVLEKALGVRKGADLKEIKERTKQIRELSKK